MGLWIAASIVIRSSATLAETAAKVAEAFGICFSPDKSGRYEEYPAYSARALGLELAILGAPSPEYDLDKTPEPEFYLLATTLSYPEGPLQEIDLSEHLVTVLKTRTDLGCWHNTAE